MSSVARCGTYAPEALPSRKRRAAVCLLAFVLVTAAVYLAASSAGRRGAESVATAVVRQPADPAAKPLSEGITPSPPDLAAARDEILSESNLAEALRLVDAREEKVAGLESDAARTEAVARLRASLSVSVQDRSSPERAALAITCTAAPADRAARLVNWLASEYAKRQDARRKAEAERIYGEARSQAQRAREIYREARAQWERFLEEHFQQHGARAEAIARQPSEAKSGAAHSTPQGPAERANAPGQAFEGADSERQTLAQQRAELEQRRARLLLERTPLHPEVQEVEAAIAEVGRRWEQLSRDASKTATAVEPPRGTAPAAPRAATGAATDPWHGEAVEAFLARRDAMLHAERLSEQFAQKERMAWQQQLAVPPVEVELAAVRAEQAARSEPKRQATALLIAVLAGVLAAAGVAMAFAGWLGEDAPFQTPNEVQGTLRLPVVGVLRGAGFAETTERSAFA